MLRDYDRHTPGTPFAEGLRLSIDEAYLLQARVAEQRQARGERVAGYKIGCVAPVNQARHGLSHPVWGRLWSGEQHRSGATCRKGTSPTSPSRPSWASRWDVTWTATSRGDRSGRRGCPGRGGRRAAQPGAQGRRPDRSGADRQQRDPCRRRALGRRRAPAGRNGGGSCAGSRRRARRCMVGSPLAGRRALRPALAGGRAGAPRSAPRSRPARAGGSVGTAPAPAPACPRRRWQFPRGRG